MSDSVKYAISVKPIEVIADENGGEYNVIAGEVGKTLGCSGTALVANYTEEAAAQGYLNAAAFYREAIDSADTTALTQQEASFVFIKNTGYTYSSTSALGVALAKSLKVMVGDNDKEMIAILDAGEGIVLKDDNSGINCFAIYVRTVDTDGSENASAGHLAVEFLTTDV